MSKFGNIFQYSDFRKALQDYYLQSKEASGQFSFSVFSKRAGLASPNYLKLVMDGNRRLTTANIQRFALALGLAGEEVEYFEALVLENQAETNDEKRYYAARLKRIRRNAPKGVARRRPSQLLETPLQPAVLLCALGKTREDAIHFSMQELDISHEGASAILDGLLQRGDLRTEEPGGLLRTANRHTMMSDPKGLSDRQKTFLKTGLEEARMTFDLRYPTGPAKFLSLLLTAPEGSLKSIFSDLKSAMERIAEQHEPTSEDIVGVYRAQFQVYRMRKAQE